MYVSNGLETAFHLYVWDWEWGVEAVPSGDGLTYVNYAYVISVFTGGRKRRDVSQERIACPPYIHHTSIPSPLGAPAFYTLRVTHLSPKPTNTYIHKVFISIASVY